ncbi:hypothetical protein BO94DRAFT_531255 [Aspergillus sclerotioniger CBS 115572]|uniref:CENP-S associating centromere protein X-domain-containing protein n=1 Tax=Aspergillus sclerotioniger CBS 115572 TaxID=1450535 RepID=A0A317X9S5_9EURO|nr:hypothetical protein BO94DRAFT_531255 [Aspergillus sclerotioniger CBS 115572]PWY95336.1 hypothetical protein BO94DRAFT_531255 [Aspergillus sclerotioniger CBS 115572]
MPAERKTALKRRQLPFKPPSRTSASASASVSTSAPAPAPTSPPPPAASKPKPKPKSKPTTKPKPRAPKSSAPSTTTSKPARPSTKSKGKAPVSAPASDNESDSSSSTSSSPSASPEPEPDYILAEIIHNETKSDSVLTNDPVIPPKLLTRLLHHHFQNQKTKIAKDANTVVAKYVDVFVREALARAAFERREAVGKGVSVGDGFLEVEDLEKMAPQLVMDF